MVIGQKYDSHWLSSGLNVSKTHTHISAEFSGHQLDMLNWMQEPKRGEVFTAKVDRISGSGNGIIEIDRDSPGYPDHINIGPVFPDCVGKEIKAKALDRVHALCLTDSVKEDNYKNQIKEIAGNTLVEAGLSPPPNGISTGLSNRCPQCDTVVKRRSDKWVCPNCEYTHLRDFHVEDESQEELRNETSSSSTTTTNPESDDDTEDSEGAGEEETDEAGEVSGEVETVDGGEKNEDSAGASLDIGELRKKATADATERVDTTAVSSSTKQEYNRSTAVKEYVKARADGVCEGCNTSAPFTSKTGEPYLHAHHIHELSDGGSDTVDTVVALCPNCHYRVHHGEDGDEYNQKLLEVVQRLENEDE